MKSQFLILAFVFFMHPLLAQVPNKKISIGLGIQAYPAGFIPYVQSDFHFPKNMFISARLGYNITDRQDFSPVNDHEKGGGPGCSIGLNKSFGFKKSQFFVGLLTDVWLLQIDWKDKNNTPDQIQGTTEITVLQPWLNAGYRKSLGTSPFNLTLGVGFGREINIVTKGDAVAQGWMGSILVGFYYHISSNKRNPE